MALFDSIISEAQNEFDLGGKAEGLVKILLAMLSDEENGGFSGFLSRFEEAGLGDLATSWINSGANMPISYEQTESVFGEVTLREVAGEAGLDYETATSATALLTPHIVDELTPTGELPNDADLPVMLGRFMAEPATATVPAEERQSISATAFDSAEDALVGREGSILKLILPLLLVLILIGIGYMVCGKSNTQVRQTSSPEANNANTVSSAQQPASEPEKPASSFSLKAAAGKYTVSGVVTGEALKDQIIETLTAQFGEGNVDFAGLRVDAGAGDFGAGWWAGLSQLLPDLKGWQTGELSFAGSAVTAANGLPPSALAQVKTLFAEGWQLPVSIIGAETAAKQANENALQELTAAKTAEQVVRALNISIINFPSGSAVVPADAQTVLQKAAEVLKTQPAGITIEIGGHTDSDGPDAANLRLSEARANAVRNELIKLGVAETTLTAKGYGEVNPVAANDTPDNKFKNRRIEYKRF